MVFRICCRDFWTVDFLRKTCCFELQKRPSMVSGGLHECCWGSRTCSGKKETIRHLSTRQSLPLKSLYHHFHLATISLVLFYQYQELANWNQDLESLIVNHECHFWLSPGYNHFLCYQSLMAQLKLCPNSCMTYRYVDLAFGALLIEIVFHWAR